jgi:AraC family transcriptional regulator
MSGTALPVGRHYGAQQRTRRIGRFVVTETSYVPRLATPWHFHESAALSLVIAGSIVERFAHVRFECATSSVIFRPGLAEHLDVAGSSGATCFIAEPDPDWLSDMSMPGARMRPLQSCGGRASWLLFDANAEFRLPDAFSALAIEGLLLSALTHMARWRDLGERPKPQWLSTVRDILHDRLAERLSLSTLAKAANVHPVHLASSFRAAFGVTIGEYVRRTRVDAARAALRSDRSISHIALDLGFANPSHFARVFSKHTGVTPSVYRRMQRTP